jgi:hypothetical protein
MASPPKDEVTMHAANDVLSLEETQALIRARGEGRLSVSLYRKGEFSEADFVLFGVLERLVIRRRLAYLGRSGDQFNAAYHYGLAEGAGLAVESRNQDGPVHAVRERLAQA